MRRLLRFQNSILEPICDSNAVLTEYVEIANSISPDRYTDADPLKTVRVDPNSITRMRSDVTHPARFGRVKGGDWDLETTPIREHPVYESFSAHFSNDVEWQNTKLYHRHRERIRTGKAVKGLTSMTKLEAWYAEMDDLYERLRTNGYLSQRELLRSNPAETIEKCNDASSPERNEIGVNIGRTGELIWRHRGKHRLFLAKILDLDAVPVQILTRHRLWQRYRYRASADPSVAISHPDLRDVA